MRGRFSSRKARIAIGSAFVLLVVLVLALSVNRYRTPQAAPPEALAHIADKNRDAAISAAAHQRAASAASTSAAESLAEARDTGAAEANAMLARFPNIDNRTEATGRGD